MPANNTFALRSRRVILDDQECEATIVIDNGCIAKIMSFDEEPNCKTTDVGEKVIMPGLSLIHI